MPRSSKPAKARSTDNFRLSRYFPYHLSVTADMVSNELAARLQDEVGLDRTEWRVMAVLGSFAPLSTGSVAEHTTINKVAVSRAVARLVQLGYVLREVDEMDNRLLKLRFSRTGEKVFERICSVAASWSEQLLSPLSEKEIAVLEGLLSRVRESVAQLRSTGVTAAGQVATPAGVYERITRSGGGR